MGYLSGLSGPLDVDTQVRGQKMLSPPDMETATRTTSLVLSDSGVHGPDAGVGTPAATDAAGEASPSPSRCSRIRTRTRGLQLEVLQ